MMIKPTLSILLWLPLVVADYGNYGESSTSTMSDSSPTMTSAASSSGTHTVDVGEHGLSFDPDTITAAPGDMVEFHFYPGNHSVAQASFDNPCHPMSSSSFFSGFVGATGGESETVFTLTINDTKPIWYYCGQIGHCQAGMVGVINPPTSGQSTLDAFKKAASNANGDSVPSMAQGGMLGASSSKGSTTTATTTGGSGGMSTGGGGGGMGTTSSTASSSPSATNTAEKLHLSTDLGVISFFTSIVAMLLM